MKKTILFAVALYAASVCAQSDDRETRKQALAARQVLPSNMGESSVFYGSSGGYSIAAQPKIKPDGKSYRIDGQIELTPAKHVFIARNRFATSANPHTAQLLREMRALSGQTQEPYFAVTMPQSLISAFQDNARINGTVDVIGVYSGNTEITLVNKTSKTIPVLQAVAIEFNDDGRMHHATAPKLQPSAAPAVKQATTDVMAAYKVTFDCSRATNFAEKSICSNPKLGQLDGLLFATYKSRMSPPFDLDKKQMLDEQRQWIKKRNACTDESCIEQLQRVRINDLCEIPVSTGVKPTSDCERLTDKGDLDASLVPGSTEQASKQDDAQLKGNMKNAASTMVIAFRRAGIDGVEEAIHNCDMRAQGEDKLLCAFMDGSGSVLNEKSPKSQSQFFAPKTFMSRMVARLPQGALSDEKAQRAVKNLVAGMRLPTEDSLREIP